MSLAVNISLAPYRLPFSSSPAKIPPASTLNANSPAPSILNLYEPPSFRYSVGPLLASSALVAEAASISAAAFLLASPRALMAATSSSPVPTVLKNLDSISLSLSLSASAFSLLAFSVSYSFLEGPFFSAFFLMLTVKVFSLLNSLSKICPMTSFS